MSEQTFESALEELETLIKRLESGKITLEDAISSYEKGNQLKKFCEEKLQQAKLRVEKITIENGGGIKTAPFEGQ